MHATSHGQLLIMVVSFVYFSTVVDIRTDITVIFKHYIFLSMTIILNLQ